MRLSYADANNYVRLHFRAKRQMVRSAKSQVPSSPKDCKRVLNRILGVDLLVTPVRCSPSARTEIITRLVSSSSDTTYNDTSPLQSIQYHLPKNHSETPLRAPPYGFLDNVTHTGRGIIIRTNAHAYCFGKQMVFDVQVQKNRLAFSSLGRITSRENHRLNNMNPLSGVMTEDLRISSGDIRFARPTPSICLSG